MLDFFPTPYPDELWYSVISRYYMYSGYMSASFVLKAILGRGKSNISILFAEQINYTLSQLPNGFITAEEIILKHTAYPYYVRHFPSERKKKLIDAMKGENGLSGRAASLSGMGTTKKFKGACLRYCPLCAEEDVKMYGETYWHRIHQIPDIRICPKHCIYLNEAPYPIRTTKALHPPLFTIEAANSAPVSEQEVKIAIMTQQFLDAPMCKKEIHARDVFDYPLVKKGYRAPTGRNTNKRRLTEDMARFIMSTDMGNGPICAPYTNVDTDNIVRGRNTTSSTVLHFACFLDISLHELIHPQNRETVRQRWDKEVTELWKSGWKKAAIAERYGMSEDTIEDNLVRLGLYERLALGPKKERREWRRKWQREWWLKVLQEYPGKSRSEIEKNTGVRSGIEWLRRNDAEWLAEHWPEHLDIRRRCAKHYDWIKLDKEHYPKVEAAIRDLKSENHKVTYTEISGRTNITVSWLKAMPGCKALIDENRKTINAKTADA